MSTTEFGVNYTPSIDWMYQWLRLDESAVRADFASIAALGFDHVRVFPLWPVLQPNRTLIRLEAVEDVAQVVRWGSDAGLRVYVDILQGHLSGFDFLPAWLLNWHRGNMFADPEARAAQADLVRTVHERLRREPGFAGLTLGNETNQFTGTSHPEPMPATRADASRWLTDLLDSLDTEPGTVLAHSTSDLAWYRDDHPFTPRHAVEHGTVTTVHSWIFNGTAARYGGLSQPSVRHGEYLVELAHAFALDPHRPVWLQEIGAPSNELAPDQVEEFAERSVEAVLGCRDLHAITWWCSHDIPRSLSDFVPLEYDLGLLTSDRMVKPIGLRLAELIADVRSNPRPVPVRHEAVTVPVDEHGHPLSRQSLGPGGSVFEAWHTRRADGELVHLRTRTMSPGEIPEATSAEDAR